MKILHSNSLWDAAKSVLKKHLCFLMSEMPLLEKKVFRLNELNIHFKVFKKSKLKQKEKL